MAAVTCTQHTPKSAPGTTVYRRRQPERSVVYQVMQGHLETWLAGCRQADGEGLPVAVTISSSRSPVKGVVFVPPAIPGGW